MPKPKDVDVDCVNFMEETQSYVGSKEDCVDGLCVTAWREQRGRERERKWSENAEAETLLLFQYNFIRIHSVGWIIIILVSSVFVSH